RRLPELASAEDAERIAVTREIAADGVERVIATRNELLHDRAELFRARDCFLELGGRLAAKRLALVAALELDRAIRLDDDGERPRVERRNVDSGRLRRLELHTLALQPFERVPRRERRQHLEVVRVLGDRVERVVVCREDDDLAERTHEVDEA